MISPNASAPFLSLSILKNFCFSSLYKFLHSISLTLQKKWCNYERETKCVEVM